MRKYLKITCLTNGLYTEYIFQKFLKKNKKTYFLKMDEKLE